MNQPNVLHPKIPIFMFKLLCLLKKKKKKKKKSLLNIKAYTHIIFSALDPPVFMQPQSCWRRGRGAETVSLWHPNLSDILQAHLKPVSKYEAVDFSMDWAFWYFHGINIQPKMDLSLINTRTIWDL